MNPTIKQMVIQGFEEGVENALKLASKQNPPEWKENPFHMTVLILGAINETKNVYKQMLKDNNAKFDIDKADVDAFIEEIGQKIHNKYFH